MSKQPEDASENDAVSASLTVTDRRSSRAGSARYARRQFIKQGSVFVVAAGAAVISAQAYADCDGQAGQYKRCSDSDSGENSDPRGCGRCGRSENVPSSSRDSARRHPSVQSESPPQHDTILMGKVRAKAPHTPSFDPES